MISWTDTVYLGVLGKKLENLEAWLSVTVWLL